LWISHRSFGADDRPPVSNETVTDGWATLTDGRRPNPESIIADDQKSLVLLFDPEACLLFGSIQAEVMTAIGHKAGFINGLESRRAGSSEKLRGS
jgi:hypothetical protein